MDRIETYEEARNIAEAALEAARNSAETITVVRKSDDE